MREILRAGFARALNDRGLSPFYPLIVALFSIGQCTPGALRLCPALRPGAVALLSAHSGTMFYGAVHVPLYSYAAPGDKIPRG